MIERYTRSAQVRELAGWAGVFAAAALGAMILKTFVVGAIRIPSASMENTLLPGDLVVINKLVYGSSADAGGAMTESRFPDVRVPGLRKVRPGDVVVFRFPSDGAESSDPVYFVKRCIARGGDKVELKEGICYVNDEPVRLPEGARPRSRDPEPFGPIFVPAQGDSIPLTKSNFSRWEDLIRREGHEVEYDRLLGVLVDGRRTTSYRIAKSYLFVLGDNTAHSYDSRLWGFLPEENVIGEAMMVYWSQRPGAGDAHSNDGTGSIRWNRIGTIVH